MHHMISYTHKLWNALGRFIADIFKIKQYNRSAIIQDITVPNVQKWLVTDTAFMLELGNIDQK